MSYIAANALYARPAAYFAQQIKRSAQNGPPMPTKTDFANSLREVDPNISEQEIQQAWSKYLAGQS